MPTSVIKRISLSILMGINNQLCEKLNERKRNVIERHRKFGGQPSVRSKWSAANAAGRVIDTYRSADSVSVGKCSTGLFIRAEERRFRVTASLSARRASDDSITQASLVSIAIIRRKSEERPAAGARKRRPDTHARVMWPWIRMPEPVLSTSFFGRCFLPLPAFRNENGECTLDVVTRKQSNKETPTARTDGEKAPNAAASNGRTFTFPMPADSLVSLRIYRPAGRYIAGTHERVNYAQTN